MKKADFAKLSFSLFIVGCIVLALHSSTVLAFHSPTGLAGEWIGIRTDDQTLFVTPGIWQLTQWNPSSSPVIRVDTPIKSEGRIIGYAAETKEPWRFVLQQYMAPGLRNPSTPDKRLMAYFIPADGVIHAVILTQVQYGGRDGQTVIGVQGTCQNPRNGLIYDVTFERL